MEASCRLPAFAVSSASRAGRFNSSWSQTWGFAFRFLRGDHKAVIRVERPRLDCLGGILEQENFLVIAILYRILWFAGIWRRKVTPYRPRSINRLPVAKKSR